MRTTVNVQDNLLKRARQVALEKRCSLGEVIDDALRSTFFRNEAADPARKNRTRLITFRGRGLQPGVDLDNSSDLLERMEGR